MAVQVMSHPARNGNILKRHRALSGFQTAETRHPQGLKSPHKSHARRRKSLKSGGGGRSSQKVKISYFTCVDNSVKGTSQLNHSIFP